MSVRETGIFPKKKNLTTKKVTDLISEVGTFGVNHEFVGRNWSYVTAPEYVANNPSYRNKYHMLKSMGFDHVRINIMAGLLWPDPLDPEYHPRYRNGDAGIENLTVFDKLDDELDTIRTEGLACIFDLHTENASDTYGNTAGHTWGPVASTPGIGLGNGYNVFTGGFPSGWRVAGTTGDNIRTAVFTNVASTLGRTRAMYRLLVDKVVRTIVVPHANKGLQMWFEPVNEPQVGNVQTFQSLQDLYKDILSLKTINALARARVPLVIDAFGNMNSDVPSGANNYGKLPYLPKASSSPYALKVIRNGHSYYPFNFTHGNGGAKGRLSTYATTQQIKDQIVAWANADTSRLYVGEWGAVKIYSTGTWSGSAAEWKTDKTTFMTAVLEQISASNCTSSVWSYGWATDMAQFGPFETQFTLGSTVGAIFPSDPA